MKISKAGFFAVAVLFVSGSLIFLIPQVVSQKALKENGRTDLPVADLPSDDETKTAANSERWKRNRRYDTERVVANIDRLGFKESDPEELYDLPVSHSAIEALPVYQSDAIIVGKVTDREAHFSNDRTAVYSEFSVRIEQVILDSARNFLRSESSVVLERPGGAVRLPSGKLLKRGKSFERMPLPDRKYVFFLKSHEGEKSFSILTAYELRDGKVFPLDGMVSSNGVRRMKEFQEYESMHQHEFLNLVINEVAKKEVSGQK